MPKPKLSRVVFLSFFFHLGFPFISLVCFGPVGWILRASQAGKTLADALHKSVVGINQ